jgi:hypothetical protein
MIAHPTAWIASSLAVTHKAVGHKKIIRWDTLNASSNGFLIIAYAMTSVRKRIRKTLVTYRSLKVASRIHSGV